MKWSIIGLFSLGLIAALSAVVLVVSFLEGNPSERRILEGPAAQEAARDIQILVASRDLGLRTVVSAEDPDGPELLLEPAGHPAVSPYREALVADGIPLAQFTVPDVAAEHERLTGLGVAFTQPPLNVGPVSMVVFDDTCGNLIQYVSPNA